MALKAADVIKVNNDTSAPRANISNKIVALKNPYIYTFALLKVNELATP